MTAEPERIRMKKKQNPKIPPQTVLPGWPETEKQLWHIPSDVQGSYTGVPEDFEVPVQDADDL